MAVSAHAGLTPSGQVICVMTFRHILIQLMEWLEMLMGLELSKMMKHSGFALMSIPAAHPKGVAVSDLQAARTLC